MVVGWRLRRQPTTIHKHKTLIVISNEVRNLLQSFRYKVYQITMLTNNYFQWNEDKFHSSKI